MSQSTAMAALIRHVQTRVSFTSAAHAAAKIKSYSQAFDKCVSDKTQATLNVFVFHVTVPASHRKIEYVDCSHDHWAMDYHALADHFLWATLNFNKGVHVYYVTNDVDSAPTPHPNVTVVRLMTDGRALMYERVKAMVGYVYSTAFSANTVFLDTDAYPNRSLGAVFKRQFDLGVTYRTTPGYMPVNEGVIFCSRRNVDAARRFFATYLNTFDALKADPLVLNYYGDIDRWRGGQLSLNALALPNQSVFTEKFIRDGIRIELLPCNQFNYWVTKTTDGGYKTWDRKFVLHLKGDSKRFLDHIARYQLNRRPPSISVTS